MKSAAASLAVVLLVVISNSLGHETSDANQKCKCLKTLERVPIPSIKTVLISPPHGGCRNLECIVTLKNGKKVCVVPKKKWLEEVVKSKRIKATAPNRTVERQRQDSK
ncbi:C-X-C motif chemokine 2-like [Notamacropus eugenii]|uniref:C-X-C motif chemokine 2-like n=1 Tax=Notamacropus eugenii TaxID=9315 RepID=UPI003B675A93